MRDFSPVVPLVETFRFDAIGTGWQIDTLVAVPTELKAAIADRIEAFDHAYSRFRSDSLVMQLAQTAGTVEFPSDAVALFELYERLYRATGGSMTPLVGASLEHLGYDASYSLVSKPGTLVSPAWAGSLTVDGTTFSVTEPTTIDVGAAGKGYLVDLIGAMLRESGIVEFVIDASGDIVRSGAVDSANPYRVALEHPYDATRAIGVVELGQGALCASASNRRSWGSGLHHVVDGLTGRPVSEVVATWVLSEHALDADGLATALFFVDADRLLAEFDFHYVRMFTDGRAEFSEDLPGELFR